MKLKTFSHSLKDGWNGIPGSEWDSSNTLLLVFGATEFIDNPGTITDLRDRFPSSVIGGCSTAGEILDSNVRDNGIVGAAVKFEKTEVIKTGISTKPGDSAFEAGKQLAGKLQRHDLRGVIVFSDGLSVNGSKLVKGLNSVLPSNVTVTGGLAGDMSRFSRTWVLRDGVPTEYCVTAIGFYGDSIRIGHGSQGGFDIFGPERTVTKSNENVLFELDGKPALELYKRYLGERAAELPASALRFPLAFREHQDDQKQLVRTILAVDEAEHSLTFAGDLPEGGIVQLMRANYDRLIDGASEAAKRAVETNDCETEMLSLAISCIGRRLILGERTEEELEAVRDNLPEQAKQIGFYSYGEISPYSTGHCDLHNETMTITTITEV